LVVAFFRTCLVAAQPAIRHQLLTLKKTRPFRSNGCPDVWVLLNESGSIELEALTEEVESAAEALEILIDSDVIPDEVMTSLIEHLNSARVLDVSV
jgi:hypothetical protein